MLTQLQEGESIKLPPTCLRFDIEDGLYCGPPYGPEQNRFHTRMQRLFQPASFVSHPSYLFCWAFMDIASAQTKLRLSWNFPCTGDKWLRAKANGANFSYRRYWTFFWPFHPADPNSLYGRVLCVHAHIQGPKSRRIAIMHSKGAFSQSPMFVQRCIDVLWN